MRTIFPVAGLAIASLLAACSPTTQTEGDDEKSFRAETAAAAKPREVELPVVDADGNELDPQLADAVREKMEEDKAALESGADDASAPSDDAVASDDEG